MERNQASFSFLRDLCNQARMQKLNKQTSSISVEFGDAMDNISIRDDCTLNTRALVHPGVPPLPP